MVKSIRITTLFVIVVNTLFLVLDYATHPGRFDTLLGVRMAWNGAMLAIYWLADRADPLRLIRMGILACGFALLGLIAAAGGLKSDYWPGMMILLVGIPVFLPVSGQQAAVLAAVLLGGFATVPLLAGEDLTLRGYAAPVFFVFAAALECVASSALLDRLRFADFRQRKELEQARDHLQEMDKVKSRFTANIHHELRTPLTLTLAPLEGFMAGEFGDLTELQSRYLEIMHGNALRLLRLINDLLDLAKIESDELAIHRQRLDVQRIAQELVAGAQPLAARKRIDLSLEGFESLPPVCADPDALEKVLLNLISNALKFTDPAGRIAVIARESRSGIEVCVHDDGIGIAPDQLGRIFDRFAQVDASATRKHDGTGIGLSLAKELIELHEGRMWARSEGLGTGSTIGFWLPIGQPDEEESEGPHGDATSADRRAVRTAPLFAELEQTVDRWERAGNTTEEDVAGPEARGARPEILVCEDNPDMRRLLCDLLSREFGVRLASSGRAGIEAIANRAPDLVLTDVMMPEMSGIELCECLKGNPETEGIPVVLITSRAERRMKIEGLEAGADDYVTKPFHARELLARVRSLVKLRRLQEELARRNTDLLRSHSELERAMADLKTAEAHMVQTERLAAVGELAAGIAHEVNNPINFSRNAAEALRTCIADLCRVVDAIAGTGIQAPAGDTRKLKELMNEVEFESLVPTLHELTQIIGQGLDRTTRLVGDLREFAAPQQAVEQALSVPVCLGAALQLTRHALQKAGVTTHVEIEDDLPVVWGDPQALGQVFLNLLKNAAEALDQTGGTLRVGACCSSGSMRIEFEDDGRPVPQAMREKIFEPFVTTKPPGKGTGLGLSISRKILRDHGGSLDLERGVGGGNRFVMLLPLEATDVQ